MRFPLGTIAISGPNGAGKSTILEAIGFALFDCLPYRNQREFMRHNATEADVRVSFLSRLDECEYQAVRTLNGVRQAARIPSRQPTSFTALIPIQGSPSKSRMCWISCAATSVWKITTTWRAFSIMSLVCRRGA